MKKYAKLKLPKKSFGGGIDYTKNLNNGAGVNPIQNGITPASSTPAQNNSIYDTAVGAASVASPVVGGLIGLGNKIGAPIKANAEQLNPDGTLVDSSKAKQDAVIGGLFDPFKALQVRSSYAGGWGDIDGSKYAAYLERNKDEIAKQKANEEAQRQQQLTTEQMNYSKGYNMINPVTGKEGVGLYAKWGGKMKMPISMDADGGKLNPLSSNSVKVDGNTHAEGGVDIKGKNGNPVAEVEDDEVIVGDKVFSKKLGFATMVEPIAKTLGKAEKQLSSATDELSRNTANRNIQKAKRDIEQIYQMQLAKQKELGVQPDNDNEQGEQGQTYAKFGGKLPKYDGLDVWGNKIDVNPQEGNINTDINNFYDKFNTEDLSTRTPADMTYANSKSFPVNNKSKFNWVKVGDGFTKAVPYLDNIYNSSLINQTPEIPKTIPYKNYDKRIAPMITNVNAQPQLNAVADSVRGMNTDINNNTSNSVTARRDKLATFSKGLTANNDIMGNKFNTETGLKNTYNTNATNIINENIANRQGIDNANIEGTNKYNYANMMRTNNVLSARSSNVSNAVNDATKQIQDHNAGALATEKEFIDFQNYADKSAGVASLIGTPDMDRIMRNPTYRQRIRQQLGTSGQNDALDKFNKTYGTN